MTRAGASKNKATDEQLKEIADSIGVGANSKNKKKTMKTLTGRQRGKPIDALTRRRVAMRILLQKKGDTYRVLSAEFGVSHGSIKNIKDKLTAARLAIVHGRGGGAPVLQLIDKALADRPRVGGASKRKIGADEEHATFLIDLLETKDSRLQLSELCELFHARFDVHVSHSTMSRFLNKTMKFSRQRAQKQLPQQAVNEKNLKLRRDFVEKWFDGADRDKVGTNDEQEDQKNWRLKTQGHYRGVTDVRQLFWIDETGCNRHTLLRKYGWAKRNKGVRNAGKFDGQKGGNHSVIIAIGANDGVIART